jgi:hypothetical protein
MDRFIEIALHAKPHLTDENTHLVPNGRKRSGIGMINNTFVEDETMRNKVILLSTDSWGKGDEGLGQGSAREWRTRAGVQTCADEYEVSDKLYVREISTMKRFIELSVEHEVFTIARRRMKRNSLPFPASISYSTLSLSHCR